MNIAYVLIAMLLTPQTQSVSVKQAADVLGVSVLIRAKQYIVDPFTKEVKPGMAGCSGTYVSGDEVLTAAHCFGEMTAAIWVRGQDPKTSYKATLKRLDKEHDLALLKITGVKNHPFAKIAASARPGETVINVGSPLSFEFLLSEGIVSSLGQKTKMFESTYTITTAMINPGSSGGGAFNEAGELIGVNTMAVGIFGWTGISMAVDIASIQAFLNPPPMSPLLRFILGSL